MFPYDVADDALAVAVPACGVDEVHPEVDRTVQCPDRLVLGRADPVRGADAPSAVPDLRHAQATAAELPILHHWLLHRNDADGPILANTSGAVCVARRLHRAESTCGRA